MSQGKGERTLPCVPSPVLAVKDYEAFVRVYLRESWGSRPKSLLRNGGSLFLLGCLEWQGALKADFMSTNAQQVINFVLLLSSISLTREREADSVERPALKPCWLGLSQSCAAAKHFNLARMTFSRILERLFRVLLGRKQFECSFLLFFRMTIEAVF